MKKMKKNNWVGKRILITGVNSLVGWNLFQRFEKKNNLLLGYGHREKEFHDDRFFSMNGLNVSRIRSLLKSFSPDVILFCKGICDYDLCERNPQLAFRINVDEMSQWLMALRDFQVPPLFAYFSSDHVFSGRSGLYTESMRPSPVSVYGKSRVEAEKQVRESTLPFVILRSGLLIANSPQGNKGPHDFLLSRLRKGKPVSLFTDEWRTPVSATHLMDCVESLDLKCVAETYHVASELDISRYDLGCEIAREQHLDLSGIQARSLKDDEFSAIRPKHLTLRSEKLPLENFCYRRSRLV